MLIVNTMDKDIISIYDDKGLKCAGKVRLAVNDGEVIGPRECCAFHGGFVVACCYDNSVRVIDTDTLKEIKAIKVGSYPVAVAGDEQMIYVACGDCNCIWRIDRDFEIAFVDNTVEFPMYMGIGRNEVCVCGFSRGEVHIYDKDEFRLKASFSVEGFPSGTVYAGNEPAVAYNDGNKGKLWYRGRKIQLNGKVGRIKGTDKRLLAVIDDNRIAEIDNLGHTVQEIFTADTIADLEITEDSIFALMFSGEIKKYSLNGKLLGSIKTASGGNSMLLLK